MIITNKQIIAVFSFLVFSFTSLAQSSDKLPGWAFGGFIRPKNVNPIIAPRSGTSFTESMTDKQVHWEANDAFNPRATIKNDKVVIIYRAEDKSGGGIGE